jgi:hypothetical protein
VIPNSHTTCAEFKDAINEALKKQGSKQNYDEVKALLLNWEANDIGHRRPIKLMPLLSNTAAVVEESETRESVSVVPDLKALISASFRGEVFPDVHDFVQWLNTECPGEVSNIEVQALNTEAAFDGYLSLVVLFSSMPISLWAKLRELPGCSLVGFVKSRNLLTPADGKGHSLY